MNYFILGQFILFFLFVLGLKANTQEGNLEDIHFDKVLFQDIEKASIFVNTQFRNVQQTKLEQGLMYENKADLYFINELMDSSVYFYDLALKKTQENLELNSKIFLKKMIALSFLQKKDSFLILFNQLNDPLQKEKIPNYIRDYLTIKRKVINHHSKIDSSFILDQLKENKWFKEDKILAYDLELTKFKIESTINTDFGASYAKHIWKQSLLQKDTVKAYVFIIKNANLMAVMDSTEQAYELLDKLRNLKDAPYLKHQLLFSEAFIKKKEEKYIEAKKILLECLSFYQEKNQLEKITSTLYHLGNIHFSQRQIETSLKYYLEAETLERELKEYEKTPILPYAIAKSYFLLNDYDKVIEILINANKLYAKYNHKILWLRSQNLLIASYNKRGDCSLALHESRTYNSELTKYLDYLREERNVRFVNQYEVRDVINENDFLRKSGNSYQKTIQKLKQTQFLLFLVGCIFLILIISLVIIIILKNQLSKSKNHILQQRMNNFKNIIIEKNKIIQNLEYINSDTLKIGDKIQTLINGIQNDKDWISMLHEFNVIYPQFLSKAKALNTNLTQTDIRLMILIKMNCTVKEIAEISNITYNGVMKAKQRLKKKLDLDKKIDIDSFIISI